LIINRKNKIDKYFSECGLDSAVVAVSGGIDSAVVLSLMSLSSVKNIYPLLLPSGVGVANQEKSISQGKELCEKIGLMPIIFDVKDVVNNIDKTLTSVSGLSSDKWSVGQLVSYARTPIIYYMTSLISANQGRGIVVGTTNLDEGSYLGYVGKASDGMVDLQVITDLHKSEVYSVANLLNVPNSILSSTPNGDMYDSRSDEDVFGASYDFVEFYLKFLSMSQESKYLFIGSLSPVAKLQFLKSQENLDDLHKYNSHKYTVGSPAVHLDIEELIYFKKDKYGWGINVE
jgi:NAD+ synthase (glutamine-hydrolysing)